MSRIVSKTLMGLALMGLLFVSADSAWARGPGGGGGGGGRSGGGGGGRSFSGSAMGGRSFSAPGISGRSVNGNVSGRNWSGGNWAGGNWNRGWNGGWGDRGGWRWNGSNWIWAFAPLIGGYGWGGYYPGYYGYGYGYGYPYYYGNYGYDDYSQPSYYSSNRYNYSQPGYSTSAMMSNSQDQYLNQAVSTFQSANYREAERLARHAVLDEPQNPEAHALLCLAAVAVGDDRTAADEAREVVSIGGVPSWSQIYGLYQDLNRFTSHLRSLENVVKQDPKNADAQMVLGFLYLAMGYRSDAHEHLAMAAEQMPNDRIVENMLSEAGGQVPATASRPNMPQSFEGSRNAPMTNQPGSAGPENVGPPNAPSGAAGSSANGSSPNIGQPPAPPMGERGTSSGNAPSGQPPAPPTENRGGTSSGNAPSGQPPAPPTDYRGASSDNSQAAPPAGEPSRASGGTRPY
jgi:hypothetical protein